MDEWVDDLRLWPHISDEDIQDYILNKLACDDQPNANYRSLIEGQNYLRSGWVGKLLHKTCNNVVTLKGPVRHSQSISRSSHSVEVSIRYDSGQVLDSSCSCMAGKGKCCSHVAGLLYKIRKAAVKGYTGLACTDEVCLWNSSTTQNVLPDTVENIRAGNSTKASTYANTMSFQNNDDVVQHLLSPLVAGLASIPGTILNHVLTATPYQQTTSTCSSDLLPKQHGDCVKQNCELCNYVYSKYIKCSREQREKIMNATVDQSSSLWIDQRKLRITSSEAAKVPKKSDPNNWISRKLCNRFQGNDATRYGHECEPIARQFYEQLCQVKVTTTGLVVHETEHWLGASLDGIVDDDTILEIKCPTQKKLQPYGGSLHKMIKENNTYDVCLVNGAYTVRQSSSGLGYYYQVQLAMHCSNKRKCKFLVWTPKEFVVADVPYNKDWLEQRVSHLRSVYFEHLLPAIASKAADGQLELKEIQ